MLGRPALRGSGQRHTQLGRFAVPAVSSRCAFQQLCPVPAFQCTAPQSRLLAAAPASIRLASTNVSVPKVHLWWRACTTSEEFAAKAGWSEKDQKQFCEAYPSSPHSKWRSGGQFLDIAANEIGTVICYENPTFEWGDWRNIVYTRNGFEDVLISLLIDVWPHRSNPLMAFTVIDSLLQLDQQLPGHVAKNMSLIQALESAFEQPQRKSIWSELPSTKIEKELVECYLNHRRNPTRYISPCTTMVGPDGVGKSYLALQLALSQGYWVGYSSFAAHQSMEFPRRSPIADMMGSAREEEWTSFLIFQLLTIQVASQLQITSSGVAKIQYHEAFRSTRKQLAKLFATIASQLTLEAGGDVTMSLQMRFAEQASLIRDVMRHTYTMLKDRGWNNKAITRKTGRYHHPLRHVIVIDQAHCPTAGISPESLVALHRAAQALFLNLPETDPFFVLMLNSAARSDDVPSTGYAGDNPYSDTHPPIYDIETWDVFGNKFLHMDMVKNHDATNDTVIPLFSHGRPLWGALLSCSKTSSISDVIRLASSKLEWRGTGKPSKSYLLALMRASLNFGITSPSLNEELAANWLNYTVHASKRRDHVVTAQPPEPLVAYAASQHLSDPHTRLSALQTLADGVLERTVDVHSSQDLTAALILLFAMHRTNPSNERLPKSVRAVEFLAALFGGKVIETVRDIQKVDNIVRDSRVYLSHFTALTGSLTQEILREAYLRGVAFYAPPGFPGGGLIIPLSALSGTKMSLLHIRTGPRPVSNTEAGYVHLESGLDGEMLPGRQLEFLSGMSIISIHMDIEPTIPSSSRQSATREVSSLLTTESPRGLLEGGGSCVKSRVRSRSAGITQNSTVLDLLLYAPGLNGTIYPFLSPPIDVKSDELHVRMTNVAVITALRRLYGAQSAAARSMRDDRYAGPLTDFSSRVHAMATVGTEYKEKKMKEEKERKEAEELEAIRSEAILARRANKKLKKERLRYK
ncbi:hypothetical protein CFIMG_008394RA00001 [Ceratocystis fimbriata CBS 114723]|uniref:Uncharacterized protein n=1 Tax=Ceratocystis fimbriata CBS 114723 TaxID=1035309 RepID=A0A2C5XHZ7_9PEZI|nr:hypothetical protein CFIMG_008394RA00001 [Ceratocystis fimbriata CBS 114723]